MSTIFETLPPAAFWRPAVAEAAVADAGGAGTIDLSGLFQPKFPVTRDSAVATAGSCFAQHVGHALRGAGLNVLDVEPAPPGLDPSTARSFGFNLYSARYGNIYTAAQMRQLLQDSLGQTLHPNTIWTRDGRHYDALRPSVEPTGCDSPDEVMALRRFHLTRVQDLFTRCALFVFTLGMTESWVDAATGTVFPTAPGVLADPAAGHQIGFHNFGFAQVLADLHAIRDLLHRYNPATRMILTVSPVPLTATASGRHVLTATTASKAVLRAAVDEFARDLPDVDYVPSFEIINHPAARGRFFAANLRSVTQDGVDLVMRHFLAAHLLAPLPLSPETHINTETDPASPDSACPDSASELICEEALAEAFRR